jgi:hypothetical protein
VQITMIATVSTGKRRVGMSSFSGITRSVLAHREDLHAGREGQAG